MKNKYWFTLIELLVVTTILILVSVSGVFYFNSFVDNYKIKSELSLIKDYIDGFDREIKNKQILDYEIHIVADSNLIYSYINNFDNNYSVYFSSWPDLKTWESTISINPSDWVSWELKVYNKYKFLYDKFLSSSDTYTSTWYILFDDYSFISYLSGSRVNDVNLKYFSETNLDIDRWDFLSLSEINDKEDKTWIFYNNIIIQNIWWKKVFYNNSISPWNIINSENLYLFFIRGWVESNLKITK